MTTDNPVVSVWHRDQWVAMSWDPDFADGGDVYSEYLSRLARLAADRFEGDTGEGAARVKVGPDAITVWGSGQRMDYHVTPLVEAADQREGGKA